MKNIFTKLLTISIVCALISIMLCIFSITTSKNKTSSRTEQVLNEINRDEEISDVEGYGYIADASTSVLADIGEAIGQGIFIIFIPGFMLFMIVISQCISRLVQIGVEKNWKNTISKIITHISIVLQVILCFTFLFNILSNIDVNKLLLILAFVLNTCCLVIFVKELAKIKYLK